MYWYSNIFIGFLFLIGGALTGYSYWKQKTNGLNIAITLLGIEVGFAFVSNALIVFGFDRLYWVAVAGQLHLLLTFAYFIWKLFDDSSDAETIRSAEKHNETGRANRTGDSVKHRSPKDTSRTNS